MFRQAIARVFCFLTVFLLSGNVVFSALPIVKTEKKSADSKEQTIAPCVEIDQDSIFTTENDPFEDPDFFDVIPFRERAYCVEALRNIKGGSFLHLSGPHFRSAHLWLLVEHIII